MKKIPGRGGFSLIEVLIALIILAVGLLAVAQLQVAAIRGLAYSRHLSAATQLAHMQVEWLRSLPYDDTAPTKAPSLASGDSVYDYGNKSVFYDDSAANDFVSLGDGTFSSWHLHADNPVNELGNPWNGGQEYFIRWRLERGGPNGSIPNTLPGGGGTALVAVPGPGQMLIEMEVIWWEGTRGDAFPLGDGNWQNEFGWGWTKDGAHRVRIRSLRQSDM